MDQRPFLLRDALHGINRRKGLILAFFVSTVVLIGVITLITPKTYKSEARLFMRVGRENASLDATATMGEQPVVMMPDSRESEINSIVELIQSKQIYEQVVDDLGAERILKRNWQPPTEGGAFSGGSWVGAAVDSLMSTLASVGIVNDLPLREKAAIKLQKKVDIEAFEKSNVLTISFKSHSPELAQMVVERIVKFYGRQHVDLHRPPKAYEFLEQQTQRIEQELEDSRAALEAYKNKTGILAADEQRKVLIERLAKLEQELLTAEAEEIALSTEVSELTDGLARMSSTAITAKTTGAGNEAADGMRQEFYKLEMQREQLASKYTPDHPRLRDLESQVRKAKSILVAAESERTESTQGPNKIHQETSVALEQKRPLLSAMRAKKAKLQEQVDQFNTDMDRFTASERQFAKLNREVEVLEANYRKYFVNLEHARIDAKLQSQELSNIGVAQPATLNLKPYSPNKLVNMAAAVFLGLCGGLGLAVFLEYLNPSLKTTEDYETATGAPVMGTIPHLSEQELAQRGAVEASEQDTESVT